MPTTPAPESSGTASPEEIKELNRMSEFINKSLDDWDREAVIRTPEEREFESYAKQIFSEGKDKPTTYTPDYVTENIKGNVFESSRGLELKPTDTHDLTIERKREDDGSLGLEVTQKSVFEKDLKIQVGERVTFKQTDNATTPTYSGKGYVHQTDKDDKAKAEGDISLNQALGNDNFYFDATTIIKSNIIAHGGEGEDTAFINTGGQPYSVVRNDTGEQLIKIGEHTITLKGYEQINFDTLKSIGPVKEDGKTGMDANAPAASTIPPENRLEL